MQVEHFCVTMPPEYDCHTASLLRGECEGANRGIGRRIGERGVHRPRQNGDARGEGARRLSGAAAGECRCDSIGIMCPFSCKLTWRPRTGRWAGWRWRWPAQSRCAAGTGKNWQGKCRTQDDVDSREYARSDRSRHRVHNPAARCT